MIFCHEGSSIFRSTSCCISSKFNVTILVSYFFILYEKIFVSKAYIPSSVQYLRNVLRLFNLFAIELSFIPRFSPRNLQKFIRESFELKSKMDKLCFTMSFPYYSRHPLRLL